MARFKTVMVETGTTTMAANGSETVTLTSTFTSTPVIYAMPAGDNTGDPGDAEAPSYDANCFVSNVTKTTGAWTFLINTEPTDTGPHATHQTIIKVAWRAIGPTAAT